MGIGTSERSIEMAGEPVSVFAELRAAMASIGTVREADEAALFLRGTTRYGLQRIRLKVDVKHGGGGSIVLIRGLSDDIWGKGAKKGIEKLVDALESRWKS